MALTPARYARAADADGDQTVRLAAPSARTVVRIVAIVVACAVALYLAWRLRDVLRLVVISVFMALALLPVVDAIDARGRVPRAAIILGLYAALAAAVIVVGVVVVPSMVKEVQQVSRDTPRYEQDLRRDATFRRYDDRYHVAAKIQADARALPSRLRRATGPLQDVTVKAFGAVGQFVTVLSVAFLLMLNGRRYVGWDSGSRAAGKPGTARWSSTSTRPSGGTCSATSRSASWPRCRHGSC